jgi:hypothetical protein
MTRLFSNGSFETRSLVMNFYKRLMMAVNDRNMPQNNILIKLTDFIDNLSLPVIY